MKKGYTTGKNPVYRRRCQCILLSNESKTVKELSETFSVNSHTICHWFNAWENQGLSGLKIKAGRGAKPKLNIKDKKVVSQVQSIVENAPRSTKSMVAQIKILWIMHHSTSKKKEWENKNLYLFFISPYSPQLNLIEILWRKMKYEWLKPMDYLFKESFILALKNIIERYDHEYYINFSKNFKT